MCQTKVFKIGSKKEEHETSSKEYLKSTIQNKKSGMKNLKKVNMHMKKINDIVFSGQPDGDLGTSFQKFIHPDTSQKIEKSANWKVIGRVKIKPPASQSSEAQARVEKVYLNQISAHKVLKALPILSSTDLLVTLP